MNRPTFPLILALLLAAAALALGSGCTGLADCQKAMANDPATYSASVWTPYGNARIIRVVAPPPGATVTVTQDGVVTISATNPSKEK